MNENIQNKKIVLQELESLLSGKQVSNRESDNEMFIYCNYMKRFYLSCSTNN